MLQLGYTNPFATEDNPYAMPICPLCGNPIAINVRTDAAGWGGGYSVAPQIYMPRCLCDWEKIRDEHDHNQPPERGSDDTGDAGKSHQLHR